MRMTKCPKVSNHFYDADKYSSCPHCAKSAGTEPSKSAVSTQSKRKSTEKNVSTESTPQEKPQGIKDFFGKIKSGKKEDRTHSLWSDPDDDKEEENADENNGESTNESVSEHYDNSKELKSRQISENDSAINTESENKPIQQPAKPPVVPSISQQLDRVAMSGNIQDIKTVAYYGFEDDIEPVVGWLALLTSEDRGTAFELKCGRNTIGRSGSGNVVDISLERDTSVSRGTQATIIYEPRKRKFMIKSNDSNTLVYVNDELLMDHEELHVYDRISLGNSELLFIPLCSDKFSWDD